MIAQNFLFVIFIKIELSFKKASFNVSGIWVDVKSVDDLPCSAKFVSESELTLTTDSGF